MRAPLDPLLGTKVPYATFYPAIAAAALLGGVGPGLLAIVLGALSTAWFIMPPRGTLLVQGRDNLIGLALYVFVSVIFVVLSVLQRRANARLRLAQDEERRLRERFEVTLASLGDGVIATDSEGRVSMLNRAASAMTGWPEHEALGRPLENVFVIRNEETGEPVENPAIRAMREGRVVGLANHTVLISRSGESLPIDDSGAPIRDASGAVVGAVLVFRGVGELKRRERELWQRKRIIDLSHDAILVMDPARRITGWNRGATELYGWDEAEALGKVAHELFATRGEIGVAEFDAILLREGRWDGELIHTCKDGREVICESRQILLRDLHGEAHSILEINRDITDRKRAAAEAEEGRRTLEALLEHVPEGIAIADAPGGHIRLMSRHGVELSGAETWELCRTEADPPLSQTETPLGRALCGETAVDVELVLRRADGNTIPLLCSAAPIRDRSGRVTGALMTWRDVSQRKRLEEQMRETAKLESLGILAGGIAHDFNNLLTGIMGNASLLLEIMPRENEDRQFAESIVGASEKAAALTRQMLAYSGRGRFVVEPVDLSSFIRETLPLVESSIPKYVELHLQLAERLPPVDADIAQLQQVAMNLVINGAEAIPTTGGRLTVTTRTQFLDAPRLRGLSFGETAEPGEYVILEVEDTGAGIEPGTLARIFDPFFTTKFLGRGLGLSAVQGIVRGHNGAMEVRSEPGRGSTFRVFFPARRRQDAAVAGTAHASEAAGAGGTILVVDDEPVVRSVAVQALRQQGYTVHSAKDGNDAVSALRSLSGRVSAVLLDLTMPGPSVERTLEEFRRLDPHLPVVLTSGYSEAEALTKFGPHTPAGFLQKPYTARKLLEAIRSAASRRAQGA